MPRKSNPFHVCRKCGRTLPRSAFDLMANGTNVYNRCRDCRATFSHVTYPAGYQENPETGCWEWMRAIGTHGYGVVSINGRLSLAHRAVYERERGPIPQGMQLDHLCRNRRCVNPDHLEPVAPATNSQRGQKARMTPERVREMRRLHGTMPLLQLASRFGMSKRATVAIISRETWRQID